MLLKGVIQGKIGEINLFDIHAEPVRDPILDIGIGNAQNTAESLQVKDLFPVSKLQHALHYLRRVNNGTFNDFGGQFNDALFPGDCGETF